MTARWKYISSDFELGERVQTHPATDQWMMGDRYGTVEHHDTDEVYVRMDKSGLLLRFLPDDLSKVE